MATRAPSDLAPRPEAVRAGTGPSVDADFSAQNTVESNAGRAGTPRLRIAAAAVLLVAAAAGVAPAARSRARARVAPPAPATLPAHVHVERDGLRYEFDALTGRERLLEVRPDGTLGADVTESRREAADRLRRALCESLGIDGLDRLVDEHREAADALRRLGYL